MTDFLIFMALWTATSFVLAFVIAPWLKKRLKGR